MFKQGKKLAYKIIVKQFGKKKAELLFGSIYWSYSEIIPKEAFISGGYPANFEWMGFCCPMTDGCSSIIINPKHHKSVDEVALTIGHELAHVLQNVNGVANHDDEIFELMKTLFCDELEYEYEGF